MTNEELVRAVLEKVGGKDNVVTATNCMTRLRLEVREDAKIDEAGLKGIEGVMGIVHDRTNKVEVVVGPGKCRKCADICRDMGIPASSDNANDWQANKAAVKANQKQSPIKGMLKTFGDIFVPLIPGVVAAGLCAGFTSLIGQVMLNWAESSFWSVVYNLLGLVNSAFLAYLPAWAGYRAAERFGATPILGGMLGMITGLDGINQIAKVLGLFDEAVPLDSILRAGRGGVLAAVLGVWVLAKVEKWVRKRMPDSLDIMFTPICTLIICLIPYILVIMPATGYISTALCWVVEKLCMSDVLIVRIIAGYVATALFLPMVAMGMHHGLVALYTVQLATFGYVTLYPALAMAGAGQVGAAIAIWLKAKKCGNDRLKNVITGALPAGFLGVGEPLIYGVTLPMGKPFLTAGLGAGFGGAFVMAMQVAATAWGPSGLLALFVMTAGPAGTAASVGFYAVGLLISYVMGFIITNAMVSVEEVANA